MLVCPQCRHDNPEEARFCTQCGGSLEPTATSLRSVERTRPVEDDIDIAPPRRASPLPGILTLVALVLLGVGAATWYVLRPNPCAGKFTSDQYPYCVALPEGWEDGQQQVGGGQADTFFPTSRDAYILVQAQQVNSGTDTRAFAEQQRDSEEAGGLFPGPLREVRVGGQVAVAWEVTLPTESGIVIRQLEVAMVRGGTGWVITFAGTDESYEREQPDFEQVLESWSFK